MTLIEHVEAIKMLLASAASISLAAYFRPAGLCVAGPRTPQCNVEPRCKAPAGCRASDDLNIDLGGRGASIHGPAFS